MSSTEGDCGSGGECGCQICGNQSDNKLHKAREMFLGTRDTFTYLQCGSCDTLQITEVPDLRPYYPKAYYAFLPDRDPEEAKPAGLKKRFARPIGASCGERRPPTTVIAGSVSVNTGIPLAGISRKT